MNISRGIQRTSVIVVFYWILHWVSMMLLQVKWEGIAWVMLMLSDLEKES